MGDIPTSHYSLLWLFTFNSFFFILGCYGLSSFIIYLFYLRTSPVGIASIIAGKILEVDSLSHLVEELGLYMVCVILGLLIHSCLTLPTLYLVLTRKNPLKLVKGALQALFVAFGTSSRYADE